MKEKNYIIGMSNNEISKKYMEIVIPEIKRVTFNDVQLWEATTPETLPEGPLKFNKTKPTKMTPIPKELSPTEKAVWYSHYKLWKYIAQNVENCWVFEHDVDLSKINVLFPTINKHLMTARNKGCMECYYITPHAAKLISSIAEKEQIYYQVDGFVYYLIKSMDKIKNISSTQLLPIEQLTHLGNTIDHLPSSATCPNQE